MASALTSNVSGPQYYEGKTKAKEVRLEKQMTDQPNIQRIFIRDDKIWEQPVLYKVPSVKIHITIIKRRCPLLMAPTAWPWSGLAALQT